MLRSSMILAWRNIRKEKAYALINIVGLAIGLAICLLVMAYVIDDYSFDDFHINGDRIFRLNQMIAGSTSNEQYTETPFPLSSLVLENVPEVESVVRVIPGIYAMVSSGDRSFYHKVMIADSTFFQLFSFRLLSGEPSGAFPNPGSIVITESFAKTMFGSKNPVGKTLSVSWAGDVNDFVISDIARDPPHNSSLQFGIIMPVASINNFFNLGTGWNTSWPETFVLIRSGVDPHQVSAKLNELMSTVPKPASAESQRQFAMQPIRDIHLSTNVENSAENASSPIYSYLLSLVCLVVLVLACINFTTLAIGRAQRRVREMGARRVLGASRWQIVVQILGETLLIAAVGMVTAIVLAEALLPHFGNLSGKHFSSIFSAVGWWLLPGAGLILCTALLAGGYPALVLSRVNAVDAMRRRAAFLTGKSTTRVLVLFQFAISAALIAVTLSMSHQLDYMLNAPLGFDKSQLMLIRLDGTGAERIGAVNRLRNALGPPDGIESVASSSADFTGGGVRMSNDVGPDSSYFSVFVETVDYAYPETMKLSLVQGRDFKVGRGAADSVINVIVNEALVNQLQWKDPIGMEVPLVRDSRVIGVVKDFHTRSFTSGIEPVVLEEAVPGDDQAESLQYAYVRLHTQNVAATIEKIHRVWNDVAPGMGFDYQFMDDHIEAQYRSFQLWENIMRDSSILAVIVACFGVLGLTSLAVARRRREMGIRKVLGASGLRLVGMFYREFVLLAVVGTLISLPLSYLTVHRWLTAFVYRAAMSPWPFIAGLLMLAAVIIITVSLQAVRAASTNPAEVIRYE